MACCSAGFRDNPGHRQALKHEGLRGQNLRGDNDNRLIPCVFKRAALHGKLCGDSADYVAQVGHAFFQILIGNLGEKCIVFFQRFVQRTGSLEATVKDGGMDLCHESGIADEHPMRPEYPGLFFADLSAHALHNGVQLTSGGCARAIEAPHFA